MSIVKVIEIISEGDSVENAVSAAVDEASKTVRNIKTVYVKDIQAIVQDNKVTKYRIDAKVSFVVGK
jgi:flavin-binding protein dodecin